MAASVSRKALLVFVSHVLGALGGLVVLLLVGRYVGPAAYGAYVFAVSLVGLVMTFFKLGFGEAHTREVAQGRPLDQALGVFVRIRTVTIVAYVAAVLLGLFVWFQVFGRTFTDATTLQVVLVILLSSVLVQWRRVAGATWRGQGRAHRVEAANVLDATVFALGVLIVAFAVASASGRWIPTPGLGAAFADLLGIVSRPSLDSLALYLALAHLAGKISVFVLFGLWWIKDRAVVGPWDRELAREYARFALPFAFVGVLSVLLMQTDILMIGYFWDSHEVGIYGGARRLAKFALLPTLALRAMIFPFLSSLMGRGESSRVLVVFRQAERYLLLFVVPLAVAMAVWPREGIHIAVGDSFLEAAAPLRYLSLWAVVMALSMPVRQTHMAAGNTQTVLRVVMINVGANVVLNLVFIPQTLFGVPMFGMGATGSAIATLGATVLAYGYNRWHARRDFGIALADKAQARVLAAGVGLALFWGALQRALPPTAVDRFWELGIVGVLGAVVYFTLAWLVRGVRAEDLRFFRAVLSPRGFADEVRGRGGQF